MGAAHLGGPFRRRQEGRWNSWTRQAETPKSYASPFSDNKTVYVQVTDADENAVTKRVDTNAYGPHRAPGRIDPASGEDWHNLADKSLDGR